MTAEIIIKILEIVGTISFSILGSLVAIKANFDLFGVVVIGIINAVGGGIIRDVMIGSTPPTVFEHPYILPISFVSSLLVFVASYFYHKKYKMTDRSSEIIRNWFSSIGLAAFSVMGVEVAFSRGIEGNMVLSVTLGVLTGVGGGLLRDIFTQNFPYIFKKHIYVVASIAGGAVYYILRRYVNNMIFSAVLGVLVIAVIRIFATIYCWILPKVHIFEANSDKK